jgi:hypothetical protein
MLVKGVLVERQPMIVGAPPKTLKTSVMCDLAVSLATGTPFLGHFAICRPVKVALFSGESGEWTLAQTLARVCRTRGLDPDATVGKMVVQPDGLPQLSNAAHMDYLRWMLAREGVEVFILDPLYLTLLAGMKGDLGMASNLYAMGPLFQNVTGACLQAGATPALVHHTQRAAARSREPLGLEDLAYSGVAEFARQWVLMSRREDYDGGSPGSHKLWLNAGGSAGHGGLWALDVEEGEAGDDLDGRVWDVTVSTATEAKHSAKAVKDLTKKQEQMEADQRGELALMAAIISSKSARRTTTRFGQRAGGSSPICCSMASRSTPSRERSASSTSTRLVKASALWLPSTSWGLRPTTVASTTRSKGA